MDQRESFAAARDGTRIWWRSAGSGAPAVVLVDGIGCAGFIWSRLMPELARRRRVLHWNYRGHGRTGRPRDVERVTLLDCVDDLFCVLDAAGASTAVLAGHSMGVQVALEAHRRAPERVEALMLVCGSPGRPLDTFHDSSVLRRVFPLLRGLVLAFPEAARLFFREVIPTEPTLQLGMWLEVNRHLLRHDDLAVYLEDLAGVDPEVFVRMLGAASVHDAHDHLGAIEVPTLVVAGEKDKFTPMRLSLAMHAAIPGSELLVLPAGTHTGPLEHAQLLALRVERFLEERVGSGRPRGARGPGPAA